MTRMHVIGSLLLVIVSMGLGVQIERALHDTVIIPPDVPTIARCDRELSLVKVTLDTARSLSRHHADSEPFQYKAGGQMETMFRVCFADPDRDTPESPGMLAAKLGDLSEAELAQVEVELDEGWRASTIGQPWRGARP